MAEFSKEELLDIIKIQQTTATQLESIVGHLTGISERQQRIIKNVENGMGEKIIAALEKGCFHCRKNVGQMTKDVMWIKILLSLVGLTTVIVTVIFKFLHH